jgi:GTPase SAR1 family protein
LVYDVTKQASLDGLEVWMGDVNNKAEESVIKCVCGNKIDLVEYQEVDLMEGEKFARVKGFSEIFRNIMRVIWGPVPKLGLALKKRLRRLWKGLNLKLGIMSFIERPKLLKLTTLW